MSRWTPEVVDYILAHYKGTGYQAMADALNERFGTAFSAADIKSVYSRHHLNSGLTGRFEKGHVPPNKGKKGMEVHPNAKATQFKAGHKPVNTKPVGSIVTRSDGYLQRKIAEPNEWKFEHVRVYEEAHGPIPEGYKLLFLDGDTTNCALDNLILVDRKTHIELNRRHLRFSDPEMTQSGVAIAKARLAIMDAKKGDHHGKKEHTHRRSGSR